MEKGSSKSLFTLIAVVIFGVFLSLSYWMFQGELTGVLASVMDATSEMTNKKLDNNGLIPTEDEYFTITSVGKITNYDSSGGKIVIIPSEINGIVVKSIGVNAFYKKGITELTLPESLEKIDDGKYTPKDPQTHHGAFAFNPIKKVILPKNLKYLGVYSFVGCTLEEVRFNDGLTMINSGAFESNRLTNVNLPNSLEILNGWAFANNKIKVINIPDSVKTLSPFFIVWNNNLETVYVSKTIEASIPVDRLIRTYTTDVNGVRTNYYYPTTILKYK